MPSHSPPVAATQLLTCPVCQAPLRQRDRTVACAAGHAFDLARQGYLNLLLGRGPRSAQAGDDRTMLTSRRRFLDSGAYEPVSDALNALVEEHGLPPVHARQAEPPLSLLDAGCGEGYYLERLQEALPRAMHASARVIGVDVSKHAVRMACARSKRIAWVAASAAGLPVRDRSMDVISSVFAPVFEEAFAAKLAPGGLLIVVGPGPRHLFELKELVYDRPREFAPDHGPRLSPARFEAVARSAVHTRVELAGEAIGDLLAMTPYTWSATQEQQAHIRGLETLQVTVEVTMVAFRRQ